MNKAVPVAIGVLVVAILAVEGKLGALWAAIKGGNGSATSGRIPSGTGVNSVTSQSAPNNADAPISLPIGNNSVLSSVSGAGVAGNAVAQTIANRRYAVDHGTDPALNEIYAKYPISNDPVSQANWQQFIACYLRGTDIQECANRWIAKG